MARCRTAGDATYPASYDTLTTDPDHVGDGRSAERHEVATDQQNADNHRDEPPFNS